MFAYCENNPVNTSDDTGHWPKWLKPVAKVALAVVAVAAVTAAVVVTAGVAATALGASAAAISGVMTGAAVGGGVAGGINIATQCICRGAENVSAKEATKSAFFGAASGALSGGFSGAVPSSATNTATKLVVQKGFQVGANVIISNTAYLMQSSGSSSGPTLYGYVASTVSGFVSGATFNAPAGRALAIAIGLEIAGNGEEFISIFSE